MNCEENMRTHPRSNEFAGYVKTCRNRMYIKYYTVMYQDVGEIAVEHVVDVVVFYEYAKFVLCVLLCCS